MATMQVSNWQVRGDSKADRQGCPSYAGDRQGCPSYSQDERGRTGGRLGEKCAIYGRNVACHVQARFAKGGRAAGHGPPKAAKSGQNRPKRPETAKTGHAKNGESGQKRPKNGQNGRKPAKNRSKAAKNGHPKHRNDPIFTLAFAAGVSIATAGICATAGDAP